MWERFSPSPPAETVAQPIKLTVDLRGKWLPMTGKGAVDRLDDSSPSQVVAVGVVNAPDWGACRGLTISLFARLSVLPEGEGVPAVEPAPVGATPVLGGSNLDHCVISSRSSAGERADGREAAVYWAMAVRAAPVETLPALSKAQIR